MCLQVKYDHKVTLRLELLKRQAEEQTPTWDFDFEFTKSMYSE